MTMTDASADVVHTPHLWQSVREPDWLLSEVLTFFEEDGDEIHGLWLLAIDEELSLLSVYLEQHFAVSVDHARRIAMVHSMWSVLLKLSHVGAVTRHTKVQRMNETTVDRVLAELDRLQLPAHADRSAVLRSLVWPAVCWGIGLSYQGPGSHFCSSSEGDPTTHSCRGALHFVLYAAARRGLLESVVWLHEVACYNQQIALECAAEHGHHHVVDWLLDHRLSNITVDLRPHDDDQLVLYAWRWAARCFTKYSTIDKKKRFHMSYKRYELASATAICGDGDALRHLIEHDLFSSRFTANVAFSAIAAGPITVLRCLREHCRHVFEDHRVLTYTIARDNLVVLQWLIENDCGKINRDDLWTAARCGQLEMLQWMLGSFNDRAAIETKIVHAMAGNHRVLEWLVEQRGIELKAIPRNNVDEICRDTELTKWIVTHRITNGSFSHNEVPILFKTAIKLGSLELVRWLVDDVTLWYDGAFYEASKSCSSEVLAFVYEAARARSEPTTAARRDHSNTGQLDTLEWLLEHGYRSQFLSRGAFSAVRMYEKEHLKKQLRLGYRSGWPEPTYVLHRRRKVLCLVIEVYDPAYLHQIKWLPMWAAHHGKLKALQQLAEIGHDRVFTRKVFDRILSQSGSEAVVRWYLEQRPELFTTLVVRWATTYGKHGVLQWVFETFLPSHGSVASSSASEQNMVLLKCVHTVLRAAVRFARHDVVRKLQKWTPMARDPSLWRGIDEMFRVSGGATGHTHLSAILKTSR